MHTRIRNNCSNLHFDLFNNHLRESPNCDCGYEIENAEHYFFQCHLFIEHRIQMFHLIRKFHPLSVNKLLFGDISLNDTDNVNIFEAVQLFIKNTRRF